MKANPAKLRQSLTIAQDMAKSGIMFVCMPVVDEADMQNLVDQAAQRFERLIVVNNSVKRAGQPAGEGV